MREFYYVLQSLDNLLALTEGINLRMLFMGAEVAQSVEQRTENPRVGGSIPSLGTTFQEVKSG